MIKKLIAWTIIVLLGAAVCAKPIKINDKYYSVANGTSFHFPFDGFAIEGNYFRARFDVLARAYPMLIDERDNLLQQTQINEQIITGLNKKIKVMEQQKFNDNAIWIGLGIGGITIGLAGLGFGIWALIDSRK